MKKMIALFLAAVIAVGLLAGCGAGEEKNQNARTITDGAGRQVEVPETVTLSVTVQLLMELS